MTWAGATEHAALHEAASALTDTLENIEGRFGRTDVQHAIHTDFGRRAAQLALQFRSVDALLRSDLYGPALALVRVGLEQVLVDSLVFLGNRWQQRGKHIGEETWARWQADRAAGAQWTRDIVEWERNANNGSVRVVREGMRTADGSQVISTYYFLLQEYVPWLGPPDAQHLIEDGLVSLEDRREHASQNRAYYSQYLAWSAIKDNLILNGLATGEEVARYDVHYRYLSGFVHPIAHMADDIYGRNALAPQYDHFASELVLLYVNALSTLELQNFRRMADRAPSLQLVDWDEVERQVAVARRLAAHLWFPGWSPTQYDRVHVANERAFAAHDTGEAVARPEDIPEADVSYYSQPLRRLVGMHASFNELMGFSYVSPWPRQDARFR